ncbi:Uncharacterized protein APZ42_006294, partial [Daphnia magna]
HLPLTVFKLVVFASPSSSLSSSPHSLQAVRLRLKVFAWSSPSSWNFTFLVFCFVLFCIVLLYSVYGT